MPAVPPIDLRQQLRQLQAPEQRRLNLALLLALLHLLLLVVQYALLAWLLNDWLQAGIRQDFGAGQYQLFQQLLPGLLTCLLLRPLLHYGREQLSRRASFSIRQQLRQRLLQSLDQPGERGGDGALASQLLDQVDALDGYLRRYVVQARLAVIAPLLLLLMIAPFSLLAAALLLLTAPLVPLFMVLLGKAAATSSRRQLQALSRLSGRFLDLIRGLKSLQQLQAVDQAEARIADSAEAYRERTMSVLRLAFLSSAVLEFFAALAIALVAVYLGLGLLGILPWAKESIPVPYGSALFILLLAPEFYAPLRQLGSDYHAKADAEAALTELAPLLQSQSWQHPGHQPLDLAGRPPNLTLQQIQVATNGRQRLWLPELQLAAGQRLLIQGASGAGKSTLLQLLLGALPWQGEIRINGQDFQQIRLHDWLQQLDYLAQTPRFIRGTPADNLRLARPDASDAELLQALEQVGLAEALGAERLHQPLGERGRGLSGGQLSRLALARLVLQNRPVWLLDEPTAHLDPDSRQQIHQLLEHLSHGKTLLLVSHLDEGLDWMEQRLQLQPTSGAVDATSRL